MSVMRGEEGTGSLDEFVCVGGKGGGGGGKGTGVASTSDMSAEIAQYDTPAKIR